MAAQATLSDVIERLRAEGQLTRNTGTNSIKSVRVELSAQTGALQEMLKIMQAQEERFRLNRAGSDTGGAGGGDSGGGDGAQPTPPDNTVNEILAAFAAFRGLGLIATAAAATIGGTLGLVIGQFKTIQLVFPKTIGSIITGIQTFAASTRALLTTAATAITTGVTNAGTTILGAITNFGNWIRGLFSTTSASVNQLGRIGTAFTGAISEVSAAFTRIYDTFVSVGRMIGNAVSTASSMGSAFESVLGPLKSFIGAIKSVAGVVGKLFVPITIVMTAFDTIQGIINGYIEGGFIGALEGGITGFFNSLVFGPIDLLKNVVSWIAGKLGFEGFAEILDSFSFAELFTQMVSTLFDGVRGVFSVVSDLFTFTEEDMSALGLLGKLTDLVYAPVNAAINFVAGMFGFNVSEEPFKLQDLITSAIDSVISFFTDLFDFLPSIEDIKQSLLSALPEWMQPDSVEEQRDNLNQQLAEQRRLMAEGDMYNWRGKSREAIVSELEADLAALPQYRTGSPGFMDFGPGSLAMLHGVEAVVPRNTPAGEFLAQNFDENLKPIMGRIASVETAAINNRPMQPIIISNAPTVAPVNNNVTGPTNVNNQRVTSIGTGSGSGLARFAN